MSFSGNRFGHRYQCFGSNSDVVNNVFIDCNEGITSNSSGGSTSGTYTTVKNNAFFGCTSEFGSYVTTANIDEDYNATDKTSAASDLSGANNVYEIVSGDFADTSTDDFHLASGSDLIDAGTNLYTDFTTDIDGDTWPSSGAWDIGADHYVSAATTHEASLTIAINQSATPVPQALCFSKKPPTL